MFLSRNIPLDPSPHRPMLRRRLTALQAVSLNMSMMVGIGPFITIPLLLQALNGPIATVGWVLGAVVAICDGLVWSELAAAFPGSGGTYHFFDAVYGQSRVGRALKFLFVWQFLVSGPLELASGMLGFASYAGAVWPALKVAVWSLPFGDGMVWTVTRGQLVGAATMAGLVALAYRRIEAAGRLIVVLWLGMLGTVAWTIAVSWAHFDPKLAFDVPAKVMTLDRSLLVGLGASLSLAMYAYLGYYQVCYLGDEVENPARTIPRSILIAVVAVAIIYIALNMGIIGAMPWRLAMESPHVASDLMQLLSGRRAAIFLSLMVMWTALASCYAALLGYSRIPYAAARSGHFFRALAATHPTGDFPHRSLLLLGTVAVVACLADLQTVIDALLTTRILVQFVAQIATVAYVRYRPDLSARMPFRMPLYPLPAFIALLGWLWIFATSSRTAIHAGLGTLAIGLVVFVVYDARNHPPMDKNPEIDKPPPDATDEDI
jgi:amino acid transporter